MSNFGLLHTFAGSRNVMYVNRLKFITILLVSALLCPLSSKAQVAGLITDGASNEPVAFVNILVVGTDLGFVSDMDGRFRVSGASFPVVLRFSAVGYETLFMEFSASQEDVSVRLVPARLHGQEILVRSGRIITGLNNRNPIPVTTITYDDLLIRQNSTAADLLRAETGVYVQQTTPGQGSIYVRGRAGRDVLYLFNGLRMNPSFVRSGQNQYFGSIDPFSVDQIDVFRGPISTFYGSDALSGGVNVQPRIAQLSSISRWNGRLQSQLNLAGNGEKTLHAEIGRSSKKISAAFAGTFRDFSYYKMSQGVDSRLYFPYNRNLTESDFTYQAVNGSMRLSVSPRTTVEAIIFGSTIPDAPRWDRMIVGYSDSDSPSRYYDSNTSPLTFTASQVELMHQVGKPWINNLRLHAGYHQLKDFRRSVRYNESPSLRNAYHNGSPSNVETHENNTSNQLHVSADLKTLLGKSTLLSWGADVSYDQTGSRQFQHIHDSNYEIDVLSRFPDGSEYLQTGLFVHMYHDGYPGWTLEGGLRLSATYANLPMEGVLSERAFDPYSQWFSQVTGSAGASYKLAENTFLVGNVGTGFRAPNVADLSEVGIRRSDLYQSANPDLKPEQSVNVDMGIRVGADHLRAELSGFMIHYFDKIDVQYTGEVVDNLGRRVVDGRKPDSGNDLYYESVSVNASSMNLAGIESKLQGMISDVLRAGMIANYTYGRIRNADGIRDYVDRIPPANGIVFLEVHAVDRRVRLRPQARFALAKRRLSSEEVGDDRISPDGTDGFANIQVISTIDLHRSLQLRIFADNITNVAYREHASTLDGMQRNITFSLNYAF